MAPKRELPGEDAWRRKANCREQEGIAEFVTPTAQTEPPMARNLWPVTCGNSVRLQSGRLAILWTIASGRLR